MHPGCLLQLRGQRNLTVAIYYTLATVCCFLIFEAKEQEYKNIPSRRGGRKFATMKKAII